MNTKKVVRFILLNLILQSTYGLVVMSVFYDVPFSLKEISLQTFIDGFNFHIEHMISFAKEITSNIKTKIN